MPSRASMASYPRVKPTESTSADERGSKEENMQRTSESDTRIRTLRRWASAFSVLSVAALQAGCRDLQLPTASTDPATGTAYSIDGGELRGFGTFQIRSRGHVGLREPAVEFEFDADLRLTLAAPVTGRVSTDGSASGTVQILFADGSVQVLRAVSGQVNGNGNQNGPTLTFLLLPYLESGEIDFARPAIAIARQSPGNGDYLLWDIGGSTIHDASIEFEVPGEIAFVPHDRLPPALPWFVIRYPPQSIVIRGTGQAGSFSARAIVARDYSADGLVELEVPMGSGPIRLEPVFGMPMPGTQTGPGFIILLVVEGAPLRLENVEIATVQPDPLIPGCDIWDFQSNGVSFDARGRQIFFPTANSTTGGNR
jgi:prepilin-type processing-associated H-X9-DG protein